MNKEELKLEICLVDLYGKQYRRAGIAIKALEDIERIHGENALKTALLDVYREVISNDHI